MTRPARRSWLFLSQATGVQSSPGRVPAAAAVALRPSRVMSGCWRGERGVRGRRRRDGWGSGGGCSPAAGRVAPERRAVGQGTPGSRGGLRWRPGGGFCASGGGARGFGMAGASWAGCGFVGGCAGPSRQPTTRASRADHHPARQRPTVRQGRLDVAGRAEASSPGVRVDGRRDGTISVA